MDTFATTICVALQYGVPLRDLVNKFAHVRFEPSGFTGNQEIPIAKSIVDYIFRWLGSRFLSDDDKANLGLIDRSAVVDEAPAAPSAQRRPRPGSRPSRSAPAAASDGEPPVDPVEAARPAGESPRPRTRHAQGDGRRRGPGRGRSGQGRARGHRDQRPRQRSCRQRERQGQRERGGGGAAPITLNLGATKVELPDPGRRPQLRRLRLDHGPQRQLLQVPQLREHERLQLSNFSRTSMKPGPGPGFMLFAASWSDAQAVAVGIRSRFVKAPPPQVNRSIASPMISQT